MISNACAGIVERGDPDRFLAVMAAPVEARRVLFPIYAFNVEISRAPWVTQEPLLAQMRLQWWVDALEEIQGGGHVRKHEVTEALSDVLSPQTAGLLLSCVEARRRDAQREGFETLDDLKIYLRETAGALQRGATRALGVETHDDWAQAVGAALGLANYLMAVPAFLQRGVNPLPDMTTDEMTQLLRDHLQMLPRANSGKSRSTPPSVRIADLSSWRATGVLRRALRDQSAIVDGRLAGSEFTRRAGLLWASLRI